MKKSLNSLLTSTLVAFVLAGVPVLRAADTMTNSMPGETAPAKPKRTTYPFYGTVESVGAGTVSLKKKEGVRVLKSDAKTSIQVNGKEGTLADVKPGYYAHGTAHKDSTGEEILGKVKFDTEAPAKKKVEGAAADTGTAIKTDATAAGTTVTNATGEVVKKAKKGKKSATNAVDQAVSPLVK